MKISFSQIWFLAFLFSTNLQAQIQEMSPMPERVTNNAVVEGFVNGVPYVYSFAGLDSTKEYSGIHLRSFRYNTQTDLWETIAPLPDDMGKIATAASRIGDIIYIIGGYHVFSNGSEVSSEKVHRYNTQTNEYLADGAPIPVAIDDQVQAVWRDSLIYVVTGWSNSQNVTNVQIYNPVTDEWMQGTPTPNEDSYPAFGASGVIFNDTIYYFGGASNGFNFPIQRKVRKGIINGDNPTDITWSATLPDFSIKAYRPGAFWTSNAAGVFWVGGSDNTYNYDGIAYNNGQGVEPNQRLFYYPFDGFGFQQLGFAEFPMDLRGVANFDSEQYIAGGMESGQMVSNKTYKLSGFPLLLNNNEIEEPEISIELFPNPSEETLFIKISEKEDCDPVELMVYDVNGKSVLRKKIASCRDSIDISRLDPGVYHLSVFVDGQFVSRKFVKSK